MAESSPNVKAFISYSWSSPEHIQWVIDLATRLMADGIDVIIDKWSLKEGQDKYSFMERMVRDEAVRKVLVISDKSYSEKADGRKAGVGTESQIISREMYGQIEQTKFIPVVTELLETGVPCLPVFLRQCIYIDMSSAEMSYANYDQLLRALYDRPLFEKPMLGRIPAHIVNPAAITSKSATILFRMRAHLAQGKQLNIALVEEYLERFTTNFDDFKLYPIDKDTEMDEVIYQSIDAFLLLRDEFIEFIRLICRNTKDDTIYQSIFKWFESILIFRFRPRDVQTWNELWIDNFRFIIYELFLYMITILIEAGRDSQAALFMSQSYFLSSDAPGSDGYFCDYGIFYSPIGSIDDIRNRRIGHIHGSLVVATLRKRATIPGLAFHKLMQTDLILYLRSVLHPHPNSAFPWYPRTLSHIDFGGSLDFFKRAAAHRYFEQLKILLGINSKDHLLNAVQENLRDGNLIKTFGLVGYVRYEELLNLKNLDTLP